MTFSSVYEMFDPLTTVRKQRFWDWFSGDTLRNYWNKFDWSGSNFVEASDGVDQGIQFRSAAASSNIFGLTFGDIRPFSQTGCVFILIAKKDNTSSKYNMGFSDLEAPSIDGSYTKDHAATSNGESGFYSCDTADGAVRSVTNSDIAVDTNYYVHKLELSASDCIIYMDGVSKVTKTTNLPANNLQIELQYKDNVGSGAHYAYNRYVEAYNT